MTIEIKELKLTKEQVKIIKSLSINNKKEHAMKISYEQYKNLSNDDKDYVSFTINNEGEQFIKDMVLKATGKVIDNIDPWIDFNNGCPDGSYKQEISGKYTKDKRPFTFDIEPEHLDYIVDLS